MNKDSNCRKPISDISNIKCLLTGGPTDTEDTTKEDEEDPTGFLNGELEDLFKEDDGDGEEPTPETR